MADNGLQLDNLSSLRPVAGSSANTPSVESVKPIEVPVEAVGSSDERVLVQELKNRMETWKGILSMVVSVPLTMRRTSVSKEDAGMAEAKPRRAASARTATVDLIILISQTN